jgi:hypothetical protein
MKRLSLLPKFTRSFTPVLSIAFAMVMFTPAARAQSFGSSILVTGDSDVLNTGRTVIAYDVSNISTTVNGVHFSSSLTNGTVTFGFAGFNQADNNGVDPSFVSSALGNALIDNIYTFGITTTLTFANLTPGASYSLQIFDGTTGVGLGATGLQDGLATGLLSYGVSGANSTAYYTRDYFTAGPTGIETISMTPLGTDFDNNFVILDAVNLQETPEPSTYAMLMGGLGVLLFVGRLRKVKLS